MAPLVRYSAPLPPSLVQPKLGMYYYGEWSPKTTRALHDVGVYDPYVARGNIRAYPERQPYLGWYDNQYVEIVQQQMNWMIEYKVDFIIFCNYWTAERKANGILPMPPISAYWQASQSMRDQLKYSILLENQASTISNLQDWEDIITDLITNHFNRDEYIKLDGRPIIYLYSQDKLRNQYQALGFSSAKEMLDYARNMAISAGFPNIYWVVCTTPNTYWFNYFMPTVGADAVSTYNWRNSANHYEAGNLAVIENWQELDEAYRWAWDWIMQRTNLPLHVPLSAGWDNRPWGAQAETVTIAMPTAEEFEEHLQAGFDLIRSYPTKTDGIAVLSSWDEYGEGTVVEPNQIHGFTFLEKIAKVFRSETCITPTPADPNAPYRSRTVLLLDKDSGTPKIIDLSIAKQPIVNIGNAAFNEADGSVKLGNPVGKWLELSDPKNLLNTAKEFTIEFKIKGESNNKTNQLIIGSALAASGSANASGWIGLAYRNDLDPVAAALTFRMAGAYNSVRQPTGAGVPNLVADYHEVAYVRRSDGRLAIYFDGVSNGNATETGLANIPISFSNSFLSSDPTNIRPCVIGASPDNLITSSGNLYLQRLRVILAEKYFAENYTPSDHYVETPFVTGLDYIKGTQPLNVFTVNDDFEFTIYLENSVASDSIVNFSVKDFWNNLIASNKAFVLAGTNSIAINLGKLKTGHYFIEASSVEEIITVDAAVVIPYENRPQYENANFVSPFGYDTAFAWFDPPKPRQPEGLSTEEYYGDTGLLGQYARATKLSGVTWIRERLNGLSSLNDTDLWIRLSDYQNIWKLQSFNNPEGQRTAENIEIGQKLPDDLFGYKEIIQSYSTYRAFDKVMLQLYNENEAYETWQMEGADKVAAVMKVVAIGANNSGVYSTFGGMINRTTSYLNEANDATKSLQQNIANYAIYQDNMFENGIMDYVNAYPFHNHRNNIDLDAETDDTLTWFNQNLDPSHQFSIIKNQAHIDNWKSLNFPKTPIWCSEAGAGFANTPYENGLTPRQQRIQARYLVTATVRSLSTGVDKHFWFFGRPTVPSETQPPYSQVFWGSFGPWLPKQKQLLPYAAYSAQSFMTYILGEGIYVGKLAYLPQEAQGYVFKRDPATSVIVIWSYTPQSVTVLLEQTTATVYNLMGDNEHIITSVAGAFSLNVDENPIYLVLAGDLLSNAYYPTIYTRKELSQISFTAAQRIVLDQIHPIKHRQAWTKYNGIPVPIGVNTDVEVIVYNFNSVAINGSVTGTFNSADYSFVCNKTVNVPANDKASVIFTITSSGDRTQSTSRLRFIGNFDDIGQTTPTIALIQKAMPVPDMSSEQNYALDVNNWTQRLTSSWHLTDNVLTHNDPASPSATYWLRLNAPAFITNGAVTMKFKLLQWKSTWDNVWAGILIRRTDMGENLGVSGYRIVLTHDGNVVAYRGQWGNEGFQPVSMAPVSNRSGPMSLVPNPNIGDLKTGIYSPMGVERELAVIFRGSMFEVWLDGAWQFSFEDTAHTTGYVGAFANNAFVYISDFRVKDES